MIVTLAALDMDVSASFPVIILKPMAHNRLMLVLPLPHYPPVLILLLSLLIQMLLPLTQQLVVIPPLTAPTLMMVLTQTVTLTHWQMSSLITGLTRT
jgi:hypothetical protein